MFKLYTLRFNAGNWTSEQCLCDSLMNSSCHTNNLKSILYSLLQDVDLLTGIRLWFMHDGAPPHFLLAVREFVNKVSPERRIGWGRTTAWPARSSDLKPWIVIPGDVWSLLFMLQKSISFRTCNHDYRMDLRWFVWNLEFSSESGSHCHDV